MSDATESLILSRFRVPELRPGQKALIEAALAGRHALGVLPTGHGKSLCYQAAADLLGGTSLVVSPLIALMRDQVQSLCGLGIAARRFDSSLEEEERNALLADLSAGRVTLLFVAPESLESPALQEAMAGIPLSLFVVDEAHCVSQWGHSFRPDYLHLPAFFHRSKFRSLMALTATATPLVQQDLCAAFGIAPSDVVQLSPYRPNIERRVAAPADRFAALLDFLAVPQHRPSIVYTRTRKGAEELAGRLLGEGFRAACYHAGLPMELREQLQDDFLSNKRDVLVATIAFGMGIDKPDVRSVVHRDIPSSPEAYLQESGRAGRDGAPAVSLVLLNGRDIIDARNRIYAAEPDAEGVRQAARWLLPAGGRVVSLWELGATCDVAEDVPWRLLDTFKQAGAVRVLGRGYKYYKVKPLYAISDICGGRRADERARLEWLHHHREGELGEAADAWGLSPAEAMKELRECEVSGEWKLTLRQQALFLEGVPHAACDARAVAEKLSQAYRERRERDLERLETLLGMLTAPLCINSALETYFTGTPSPPCGHCAACRSGAPSCPAPEPAPETPLPTELPELARPAQRCRFLLGLSSPGSMAKRLWAHPLYGCASGTAWQDLIRLCDF